jgi:predicted short-subunit dehydrogenase-like oxidoreductase (DUF2520 family)
VNFANVRVIGRGRVGSAFSARLRERGLAVSDNPAGPSQPDLVILCVPDSAIRDVARAVAPGPWIAHTSGATSLGALDPHVLRFGIHPLQTFTRSRGPEQLDDGWAAITAETPEARARGAWLAELLGLRPFDLREDSRAVYHAGASIASNYLVTLYRAAVRLLDEAGVPPEALLPLMRRTIDNGFELTGPIARGDRATVEAHLNAIRTRAPELEPMYRALADLTAR